MSSMAAVGDVLAGKYRVDKVLGIGGMGMVVAATHIELDQKVALKFMLPDAIASDQAMDRFLREAKAAVKLRSEHICRVLDVGKLDNGAPYIVMEFMEGHDFAQLIKRTGPLSLVDAVDHVMQAIEGLAEAHANGIVHRNLKPGNLFVCNDNDGSALVKVLDFGISKSSLGAGGMATKTGDVMGSPAYMAPEQMLSAKNVDGRADVWALGVILYQAVTGVLPFEAETLPALCMAVMNTEPPSPERVRADLPPPFAAVVMRCSSEKPEARWSNVAELATALAPFGGEDAAASARRSGKVLKRIVAAASAPVTAVESSSAVAPTLMSTSDVQPTPPPARSSAAATAMPGRISTLQSSAAENRAAGGDAGEEVEAAADRGRGGARGRRRRRGCVDGRRSWRQRWSRIATADRDSGRVASGARGRSDAGRGDADAGRGDADAGHGDADAGDRAAAAAAAAHQAERISAWRRAQAGDRSGDDADHDADHVADHDACPSPSTTPAPTPPTPVTTPPVTTPPAVAPEDKWTRMQHDKGSH